MKSKKKVSKKNCILVLIMGMMLSLTACSETELEERCFPLMAAAGYEDQRVTFCVGFPRSGNSNDTGNTSIEIQVQTVKGKTFEKSKEEYESHLNKLADYNHLKVLVLEDDLLEEAKAYNEMLDYLAETESFPRNTYVCAVDDMEDLMELEKSLPQDLGTYLEEYLVNQEAKKERLLTLGDLIDEKENQEMVLYMPYLEVEDSFVKWGGYVNIFGETWQDFR